MNAASNYIRLTFLMTGDVGIQNPRLEFRVPIDSRSEVRRRGSVLGDYTEACWCFVGENQRGLTVAEPVSYIRPGGDGPPPSTWASSSLLRFTPPEWISLAALTELAGAPTLYLVVGGAAVLWTLQRERAACRGRQVEPSAGLIALIVFFATVFVLWPLLGHLVCLLAFGVEPSRYAEVWLSLPRS